MQAKAPARTPHRVPADASRASLTAVLLAPRWRVGHRAAARRAVEEAARAWRPRLGRLVVAAQAAAAPALRAAAQDSLLIVPDSDSPLSAIACALDACAADPVLLLDVRATASEATLEAMLAALNDSGAGIVGLVHPQRRLLDFPLLCRKALRPQIEALIDLERRELQDLMRRPAARLVVL